jgi:hypothetical protein
MLIDRPYRYRTENRAVLFNNSKLFFAFLMFVAVVALLFILGTIVRL